MGRINRKKAAAALTAGLLGFAGTGVAVAQGGLTANLALSGTIFTVKMSHLTGSDFSLFMDNEAMRDNELPVARLTFGHANASNLCLSATLPDLPGVGEATFTMKANGENSVEAKNLVVGATDILGTLKLHNPNVGIDTQQVNPNASAGAWGIYSDGVEVVAQDIQATSVGAQSMDVQGVAVDVRKGRDNAC